MHAKPLLSLLALATLSLRPITRDSGIPINQRCCVGCQDQSGGGQHLARVKTAQLLPTISFQILENHMAPVSTFYAPVFPKPKMSGT